MSFLTDSAMIPIYSSALLDQGLFSSKSLKVDPILVRKCRNSFDFCSFERSAMIASGAPIYFSNFFTDFSAFDFNFTGTT